MTSLYTLIFTAILFIAAEKKRTNECLQTVCIDIYSNAVYWRCNNI